MNVSPEQREITLNDRQLMGLRIALDQEGRWIDAGDLSSALWRDAQERQDEEALFKMRNVRNYAGYGRTLMWLSKHGLLDRQWNDYMAHWQYAINPAGKKLLPHDREPEPPRRERDPARYRQGQHLGHRNVACWRECRRDRRRCPDRDSQSERQAGERRDRRARRMIRLEA